MQRLDRYEDLEPVARGGMGMLYRARDPQTQATVAVKLMRVPHGSLTLRKRFSREIEALRRVDDPRVVRLLDQGWTRRDEPYLVMEWLVGESLQALLDREQRLAPERAVALVVELCRALEACHRVGVLHRDLKPDNVLLVDGAIKLVDFGLTRDLDPLLSRTELSVRGRALGTPGFWAPEQATGDLGAVGVHTDVYGLGGVLHALLTGRELHQGDSLFALAAAAKRPKSPPSAFVAGVPAWLDAVTLRAVALDPAARYPSATALREALAAGAAGATPPPSSGAWRVAAALVLALGCVLAGVVAVRARASGAASEPALESEPARAAVDPTPAPVVAPEAPAASPPALDAVQPTSRPAQAEVDDGVLDALSVLAARVKQAQPGEDLTAEIERLSARLAEHPAPHEEAALRLVRGTALRIDASYDAAVADLERVIELDPTRVEAGFQLGRCYQAQERFDEAARWYRNVVEVLPHDVEAWGRLGHSLGRVGRYAEGVAACSEALALQPERSRALHDRAWIRNKLGEHAAALADADRARIGDPTDGHIELTRANALAALGRLDDALQACERALTLDVDPAIACNELGVIHYQLGHHDEAARAFQRALDHDPHAEAARNNLQMLESLRESR